MTDRPTPWILRHFSRLEFVGQDGHPTPDLGKAARFATQSLAINHLMRHAPEFLANYRAVRADKGSPRTAPEAFDATMKGVR